MRTFVFIVINLLIFFVFVNLVKKKNLLSYFDSGRWWITWFAVAIITLMDELTSIYYAPFEAYRFIGIKAIVYIALTSLFIRFLSTRMVEIAEILEVHGIKGGGVYSFSYLVLGPTISFIAVASILVVYILTASISTVSAVENGLAFILIPSHLKFLLKILVVWFIAGLNILGIRENAKFTFAIFIFASFVLLNLVAGAILDFEQSSLVKVEESFSLFLSDINEASIFKSYANLVTGIGSCILAYSGIESVLQTASLVKSWHDIRKAYIFLALTVGIVTPLIALFALSSNIDLEKHETDLIPTFAERVNGYWFGIIVSALASITLIMAVNTAMVASSELIEKICERYNFPWMMKLNRRGSLYRIHIFNAIFYSVILFITSGSQAMLAEMYAVGLVASFSINIGSLVIYRYRMGTKEITYHTSRTGTLLLFIVTFSIFVYIVLNRIYGALLWLFMTLFFLFAGFRISRFRAPEIPIRRITDSPMDVVFAIAETESDEVHIHFKRPKEDIENVNKDAIYVSFYSPRLDKPERISSRHFWISIQPRMSLFDMMVGLLNTIKYEVPPEKKIHIHFGWPLSSWIDRLSTGVMVYNIINLPKKFPDFIFHIDYIAENEKQKENKD
ncbi:Amino acid transporter [Candidatus Kryptonium thompsonii]|uniref:Amino acid transporter n=2 Tax=Candidatus Kryptonium thompsonii TaxID=1633631 RepID=A0A0N7MNZ0_9BACT|nr:APC family permease [Candidatus Kryptonium thompsoni]CUS76962.1 Amino acid transporter [Candidatus Kryptonium thompsoni]CUS77579.1 Amino acid transporter [Candidatus Kryptonium thompsoni]CUS81780.1 Amino acid transporter [Candidatus Kryptonium thompsoni]CUS90419.1 Amino acid transporter [Candidatus Kryptonium thompsoni]CUT01454.1 Amino acid transporter [Candidatus Kryptonium thompsoni]